MAELTISDSFITRELDWAAEVILWRVGHYFKKAEDPDLPCMALPPDLSGTASYVSFLREKGFGPGDRLCLMLALIPLLRPQILDCFNIRNADTGIRFVEFGCREVGEGRVLLPTLETLLFVLAETDIPHSQCFRLQKAA